MYLKNIQHFRIIFSSYGVRKEKRGELEEGRKAKPDTEFWRMQVHACGKFRFFRTPYYGIMTVNKSWETEIGLSLYGYKLSLWRKIRCTELCGIAVARDTECELATLNTCWDCRLFNSASITRARMFIKLGRPDRGMSWTEPVDSKRFTSQEILLTLNGSLFSWYIFL